MTTCDLILKDCSLLNPDMTISHHLSILIDGNSVLAVMPAAEAAAQYSARETIDGSGMLAMPGFTDGHTHVCQTLLRGRTIEEWPMVWTRFLVPFESNLTEEDVYFSTQLACLEMIKSGTTSFIESGGVHMHRAADAILESGMRAAVAESTMDMGDFITGLMKKSAADCIRSTEQLYRRYSGAGEDRLRIWMGMRQVMTCSEELLEAIAHFSAQWNTGIHAHLCEHRDEVRFCLEKYHMRPAEVLEQKGLLSPRFLSAHNVALTEHDITLLKKHDTKVIFCPSSNLSNHGFSKTPRMMEEDMTMGLGSDGASSSALSLFDQMKFLRYAMLAYWGLPIFDPMVMPCQTLLRMASTGGARAMLREDVGTIAPGQKADIILLDMRQPHLYPSADTLKTVVTAAQPADVRHSIINGKVVMKDRQVLTLDEEKLLAECSRRQQEIFRRAKI